MFGDTYASLFFDPYNPATGETPAEPTADIKFFDLPGEERKLFYETTVSLMVAEDGDVHITDSMLEMLSYGIAYEDTEFRPDISASSRDYTTWLQEAQRANPEQFKQFNEVVQSDFGEYIQDPGVQKEYAIKAGISIAAAAVIATGSAVAIGGTAAVGTYGWLGLTALSSYGSTIVAGSAIASALYKGGKVLAATGLGASITALGYSVWRGITAPDEVAKHEAEVVEDARNELDASAGNAEMWGTLSDEQQSSIVGAGFDRAQQMSSTFNQLNITPEEEAAEAETERIEQGLDTAGAMAARFDSGQQVTYTDLMASSGGERRLTYGSPSEPLPWASAPEYDEEAYGVPGRYKVSAERQPYLISRAMTKEMEAARSALEDQGMMPGIGSATAEAGYQQWVPPAYTQPERQAVPVEEYYFVPSDYTAVWTDNNDNTVWREPRYKASDNDAFFSLRTFTPAYLAIFQEQMVDAGQLRKGGYLPGMKDKATLNALQVTMGQANMTGEWYKSVAGQMAEAGRSWGGGGGGGYVRPPFVKRTYVKPDYEELSLVSKETFRQKLARDPRDWEMKLLSDKMGEAHKRGFDAVEEARWKDYERGTGGNKFTSETIDGVESPVDVMRNYFDREWAPELERQERVEVQRKGAQRFFNSMIQTDARVFGGRSEAMTQKVGQ